MQSRSGLFVLLLNTYVLTTNQNPYFPKSSTTESHYIASSTLSDRNCIDNLRSKQKRIKDDNEK